MNFFIEDLLFIKPVSKQALKKSYDNDFDKLKEENFMTRTAESTAMAYIVFLKGWILL